MEWDFILAKKIEEKLSKKEILLLKLLSERENEVVSRNEILEKIWGYDVFPSTRTIDNYILAFRKRFESKGSMSEYNKKIATALITEEQPGLIGAAAYLKQCAV